MSEPLGEAKARRVYLVLRDRILSAALGFGARLPNENHLAQAHGVSRVTVRRALAELAREQLIERRPRIGTRVMYRPRRAPIRADIAGMLADLADMGRRTGVKLLRFDYVDATDPIAEALGIARGATVQRSVRVRSLEGLPFSHLTAHVPQHVGITYTRQELAARPLLSLIERAGVKVERASQRIAAALATPETAGPLAVRVGSPLLEVTRLVYDRHGRAVEHLQALYRPDRYSLEIDLVRSGTERARTWSPVAAARGRPATRAKFVNRAGEGRNSHHA
jgi:GntR family transcriptional regulator